MFPFQHSRGKSREPTKYIERKMELSSKAENANLSLNSKTLVRKKWVQRGLNYRKEKKRKEKLPHLNHLSIIDNIDRKKKTLCTVNFWQCIEFNVDVEVEASIYEEYLFSNIAPGDLQIPQLLLKPTATDQWRSLQLKCGIRPASLLSKIRLSMAASIELI